MKSGKWYLIIIVVLVTALLGACTPQAIPALTPVPVPQASPSPPVPASSILSPQDIAWSKVVEAAKKEGKLTLYTVYFQGSWGTEMSQLFTKRTGLQVEWVVAPGGSSVERIKTERRIQSQVADVLASATAWVMVAKQDGLTQKVADIPEIRDESIFRFDPRLDEDGHILTLQLNTAGPWINTQLVKTEMEPRSWRDLLKPEWKGRISSSDPDMSASSNYIFYGLTNRGRLGQSYFTELAKQQLKFQPNTRMEAYNLAKGESSLIFSGGANAFLPFIEEGAPLKAIDMAEGIVLYRSGGVILIQGGPHPNAARVFINWLFSKEGQSIFGKGAGTLGFRKDVPSFVPAQGQLTPANPIMITLEDEFEIAKIQRAGILGKILRGG